MNRRGFFAWIAGIFTRSKAPSPRPATGIFEVIGGASGDGRPILTNDVLAEAKRRMLEVGEAETEVRKYILADLDMKGTQ